MGISKIDALLERYEPVSKNKSPVQKLMMMDLCKWTINMEICIFFDNKLDLTCKTQVKSHCSPQT